MALPNVIGEAAVRVRPDTTLFRAETQKGVQGALTGLGGLGALGSTLRFTGATAGIALLTLGAKEAVVGAADLEQSLNVLEVTSDATADEMKAIAEQARALGADLRLPGVSATDATDAMLELSKGGLDVQDSIDGTRGSLLLAKAANLDFAESAAIVAQQLSTFDLPGSQATKVTDLLTGAAQSATGEVTDLAQGLAQAGAVASNANISIEDTVTSLALLAKNGLLGSDAGTSLRTTLLRLVPSTKEAADLVKALGIEVADSTGNLLPLGQIFDQYREKLAQLTPIQQQQALTTIFGTDAIRAAAIFAREGAAGFDAMKASVTETGIAQEIAAARAEGLKGSLSGLQSGAETLATSLGSLATPVLTDLTDTLSEVVGAANAGIAALERLGDVDIPGKDLDERFEGFGGTVARALPGLGQILQISDKIGSFFGDADESMQSLLEHAQSELADRASIGGTKVGVAFSGGVGKGIVSAEEDTIGAAREMLADIVREGNEAVAEAIRQGNEAVRLSAIDARQNLISIGQELAGQALQLIDQGPLAQRIAELRASLGDRTQGNQRARLRESLADAQRELRQAEESIVTGQGPLTRAQQEAIDEFVDPFKRKVRDARAALAEFNTEGVIGELEKQAQEQKETVQRGLADLIVQFNQGLVDVQQFNLRSARLLETNGVIPYGLAGKALGIAFREDFEAQLKGLRQQVVEIARGLNVPQSGLEPNIVSPGGERNRQNANIAETARSAEQRRQDALDSLKRAQNENTRKLGESTDTTETLIAAIRANTQALGGTSGSKRGSDQKQPIGSSRGGP